MALEAFALIGRVVLEGAERVTRGLTNIGRRSNEAGNSMQQFGGAANEAMEHVTEGTQTAEEAIKQMREEMKKAEKEQRDIMRGFRGEQLAQEKGWHDLTKAAKNYTGSTKDLLAQIDKLGRQQKELDERMLAANEKAKRALLERIGTMQAVSSQAEKIGKNYDRMNNILYSVNKPLLAIADGLNNIAKAGNPARLALEMLGANANMKDLQSMIAMINAGLVRFQMVTLAAALALGVYTAALAKAAHGEAPAKIREEIAKTQAAFDEALAQRQKQLYEWASLFENVEFKVPSSDSLLKALAEQVKIFDQWAANLKTLTARGVDEGLIKELQQMGAKAAPQIQALINMSDAQLTEYVGLWRRKHEQVNEQASSELEKLRKSTAEKIQQLRESITPLALAWEQFQQKWASAVAPFVESWGQVAAAVVLAAAKVADFFNYLNNNDMEWVIQAIGWFTYLFTALTLILAPLSIGIGLAAGFRAAFYSTWLIIQPLVTGLMAMSGTVALVIVGIAAAVAIIYLLVKSFKDWINGSAEAREQFNSAIQAIKDNAMPILEALRAGFAHVMQRIKEAVQPILAELQQFWTDHGAQVMQAVQNFLGILQAAFAFVMPLIMFIVDGVLTNLIGIFKGGFNLIMGIVKIFTGLFTLDFQLFWQGIVQLFTGWLGIVWNLINLMMIGRFIKGIGAFLKGMGALFKGGLDTIRLHFMYLVDKVRAILTNFKNLFTSTFTAMRTAGLNIWQSFRAAVEVTMQAIRTKVLSVAVSLQNGMYHAFNGIKSAATTIFNNLKFALTNPIQAAKNTITGIINGIRSAFNGLRLQLPKIKVPRFTIKNWSINPANWVKAPPRIDISWHKRGAFFDQATALQGLGEKGLEAIIPLRNRRFMQPFSLAIAENLAALQGSAGQRLEVPISLNGREIVRAIVADLDKALAQRQQRNSGLLNRGNL